MKISWVKSKLTLGFYKPKSHQVVDIPEACAISHEGINSTVSLLREAVSGCPDAKNITDLEIARGDDGTLSAIFVYQGARIEAVANHLREHLYGHGCINLLWIQHKSGKKACFGTDKFLSYEVVDNLDEPVKISFTAGAFSQVNYQQNRKLVSLVLELARLQGHEKVLDLYCGNGNFTLPLAASASWVTGIEESPLSIEDARRNTIRNNRSNISFFCSDVPAYLKKLIAEDKVFDVVLLDPPRQGAADACRLIDALRPQKVIYVSCDPATLARDVGGLVNLGYQVEQSRGVDMFPQTYHLESVTLLTKKDEGILC